MPTTLSLHGTQMSNILEFWRHGR